VRRPPLNQRVHAGARLIGGACEALGEAADLGGELGWVEDLEVDVVPWP
jgi:hypothetical protein